MSSYQKLKLKCEELQKQLDMFKQALTIYQAIPEPVKNENGSFSYQEMFAVCRNEIDEKCKIELQKWVASNLDKQTIISLLKLRESLQND